MKQEIVDLLQHFFPARPIEKAWVFGSYARGEETDVSNVDIMVSFDKTANVTLIDYAEIMRDLENLLQRKVDLVQESTLYQLVRETAEQDKILVYEKNRQV